MEAIKDKRECNMIVTRRDETTLQIEFSKEGTIYET